MPYNWTIKIVSKYDEHASSVFHVNADLAGQLFRDKNIIYRNIRDGYVCLLTQICGEKVKFMISIITVFNCNMAVYIVAIDRKETIAKTKDDAIKITTHVHTHTTDNVCSSFRINGLYT